MRREAGLTVVEAIVAIAICTILIASLSAVAVTSLRESRMGNSKIQATQVLDTIGRRIAGGEDIGLLVAADEPLEMSAEELTSLTGIAMADVADMTVRIENEGEFVIGESRLVRYGIEVCYLGAPAQRCVRGTTLGNRGV